MLCFYSEAEQDRQNQEMDFFHLIKKISFTSLINMCIRTDARGLDLGYFVCGYTSTDDCQQSTAHSIGT
ncbi:hypothetical protein SAMN03080617_03882 [Algoriphagus alkaliphilus]|uniref:Uncharacterized protein n=1 Tax=Algoriphagus alkaliphilus TaxID=279824 RepID=A0A1G5ZHB7_9BACT|nr:hypothetical protein SAMN03080617_03882 [Algoriphagus alkaliphilus]